MAWSDNKRNRVKILSQRAGAYIWLLRKTIKLYESRVSRINLAIIIYTFIIGAGGIPSLLVDLELDTVRWINGTVQGLILLGGIFETVNRWLDYEASIQRLNWFAGKYTDLYLETQRVLNLDEPPGFHEYYRELLKRDMNLQNTVPNIPKSVVHSYYSIMGDHAVSTEVLFGSPREAEMLSAREQNSHRRCSSREIESGLAQQNLRRHENYSKILHSESIKPGKFTNNNKRAKELEMRRQYEIERFANSDL